MLTAPVKSMFALVAAAFAFAFSACSSPGNLLGQKDDDKDVPADEEDTTADTPEQVSGAFLKVLCDAEGFSVDKDYNIDSTPIVACVIKNDDGTRYSDELASVFSEVFKANGDLVSSETLVAPTPPWHFYVKTTPEDRKEIVLGKFKISTSEEVNEVTTDVFAHPAHQDPFLKGLVAVMMARPNDTERDKGRAELLMHQEKNLVAHMAFPTDAFYPGSVTLEEADSYCEQEGDKFQQKEWKAVLSVEGSPASQRIPITGRVYSMTGEHVSAYPVDTDFENGTLKPGFWAEAFWSRPHSATLDMSTTGRRVNLFEVVDDRLKVLDFAWTGTESSGAASSKYGHCAGWTSAAASDSGKINILTRSDNFAPQRIPGKKAAGEGEPVLPPESMPCDVKARLICISL